MRLLILCIFLAAFQVAFPQSDTLSITLENVKYAYPVNLFPLRMENQDVRMAYMDVQPSGKGNGRTVMLFHGKNFAGYYWTNVIKALTRAGFRVIVPDQIGFGKSSKPFIHYSFHELARQNKKLLDSLKAGKVIVVGHSMGGMLATRFALLFPDRVEKLILENPIGLEDYRTFVPYTSAEEQYQTELKATAESIRQYYQTSYFPSWKPEYERLVEIAAGVTNSADFPRYAKVAALTYEMIYEQPVVHEFPLLKVPTTLLIGTEDRTIVGKSKLSKELQQRYGNYKVLGKEIAGKIPGSTLVELNAGHIPHLEIPAEFIKALLASLK
jgi:pimeloyl-ACP methyl ester carboxylesterase